MAPEQQRIAIAEACGIVSRDQWGPLYKTALGVVRVCPNYLNDLNAMHEAEKVLTSEQVTSYVYSLESMNERWSTPAFATASQRAEAFLRTIGKWKEAK
jgi:hypothetical protein